MKPQETQNPVISSSVFTQQKFSIKSGNKLFKLLTDSLYANKPKSVLREIVSNALDAHKAKNELTPIIPSVVTSTYVQSPLYKDTTLLHMGKNVIDITFPTAESPYLVISDNGFGLTEDEIMGKVVKGYENTVIDTFLRIHTLPLPENSNITILSEAILEGNDYVYKHPNGDFVRHNGLYTTLGESSKDTTNDFIGSFGLGSKSPFSISDSFTVESRQNGILHQYFMFLNSEKDPCVTHITKNGGVPTNLLNGLTVTIPISPDLINYRSFWMSLLRDQFLFPEDSIIRINKTYLNTTLLPKISLKEANYLDSCGAFLSSSGNHFETFSSVYSRGLLVEIGNVLYPIDIPQYKKIESVILNFYKYYPSNRFSGVIRLPIGCVNMPASRESVILTDEAENICVKILQNTFENYIKDLKKLIYCKLKNAEDINNTLNDSILFENSRIIKPEIFDNVRKIACKKLLKEKKNTKIVRQYINAWSLIGGTELCKADPICNNCAITTASSLFEIKVYERHRPDSIRYIDTNNFIANDVGVIFQPYSKCSTKSIKSWILRYFNHYLDINSVVVVKIFDNTFFKKESKTKKLWLNDIKDKKVRKRYAKHLYRLNLLTNARYDYDCGGDITNTSELGVNLPLLQTLFLKQFDGLNFKRLIEFSELKKTLPKLPRAKTNPTEKRVSSTVNWYYSNFDTNESEDYISDALSKTFVLRFDPVSKTYVKSKDSLKSLMVTKKGETALFFTSSDNLNNLTTYSEQVKTLVDFSPTNAVLGLDFKGYCYRVTYLITTKLKNINTVNAELIYTPDVSIFTYPKSSLAILNYDTFTETLKQEFRQLYYIKPKDLCHIVYKFYRILKCFNNLQKNFLKDCNDIIPEKTTSELTNNCTILVNKLKENYTYLASKEGISTHSLAYYANDIFHETVIGNTKFITSIDTYRKLIKLNVITIQEEDYIIKDIILFSNYLSKLTGLSLKNLFNFFWKLCAERTDNKELYKFFFDVLRYNVSKKYPILQKYLQKSTKGD